MKFLLVNPADLRKRMFGFTQPQSLGYLATSLRMHGKEVDILDAAKDNIPPQVVAEIVKKKKYDVVGFYVLSPLLTSVKIYSEEIKKICPDTVIVVGGPHPTFEPEHTLTFLDKVDFACKGDGEETLPFILDKSPEEIPNLVWRKNGEIRINREHTVDINKYPMPAWDIIKPDTYPPAPIGIFSEAKKIAQIITTRGCPYPCSFCGVPLIAGKIIRTRRYENILSEIDMLISKYGIEEIDIIDDNLTIAPRKWLIGFLNELVKAKFPAKFTLPSGIRVDLVNEEILDLMKRAGFSYFALGIESANQKTLDIMEKKLKVETVVKKLEIISKYGFYVQGNFILGYPTEDLKDNLRTIKFARSLPIQKAGFFIFNPFPGTKEWNQIKVNYPMSMWHRIIEDFNLYRSSKFVKRKIPRWILRYLQIYAYISFYFRPKILFEALKRIKSLFQIKTILRVILTMIKI